MKKILVTGSEGQLGQELRFLSLINTSEFEFSFTGREQLDITSFEKVLSFVDRFKPDAIINAAAYTAVDKAEQEQDLAFLVNGVGASNLATAAKKTNSILYHVSTDFVFDGSQSHPYIESDPVSPLGVYGRSKRAGEEAIFKSSAKFRIIRTSWLYSTYGKNFVKTIFKLSRERNLTVVFDQIGSPTYARDLANAILSMVTHDFTNQENFVSSVYHFANHGVASWYDFAVSISEIGQTGNSIAPILSVEYPVPAKRPHFSVLNSKKIQNDFNVANRHWREALIAMMKELEWENPQ